MLRKRDNEDINSFICVQLLSSSWCGLLSALALLLDASTEDSTAENILKSMQLFASLAARYCMPKKSWPIFI